MDKKNKETSGMVTFSDALKNAEAALGIEPINPPSANIEDTIEDTKKDLVHKWGGHSLDDDEDDYFNDDNEIDEDEKATATVIGLSSDWVSEKEANNLSGEDWCKELFRKATERVVSNSYYDDERDNHCMTPDLDDAYKFIIERKNITSEELKKPFEVELGMGDRVKVDGTLALKLALSGDFGSQLNKESNRDLHRQAVLHTVELLKKDPNFTRPGAPWNYETPYSEKDKEIMRENSYSLNYTAEKKLGEIICNNVNDLSIRYSSVEVIKATVDICENLRDLPGFKELTLKYASNTAVADYIKECPADDVPVFKKELKKMAELVRDKNYEEIKKGGSKHSYFLENLASLYLTAGSSKDPEFDFCVESEQIKEKISKKLSQDINNDIDI